MTIYSAESAIKYYEKLAKIGLIDYEKVFIEKYFDAGIKILDIGCGVGRTTVALKKLGYEVVGIDISQTMIERAKKDYNNIDFRVCDVSNLEQFSSNSFQGAFFSFNGFALLDHRSKDLALEELSRVLECGSCFIFTLPGIDIEDEYFSKKIKVQKLNPDLFYHRLELGRVPFDDNGEKLTMYLCFDDDIISLLNENNFEVIEKTPSTLKSDSTSYNKTTIWVCKNIT